MSDNHNLRVLNDPIPASYPQLCGLCSCVNTAHTPDRCKNCNHEHQYIRADVLACTILSNIDAKLDQIGRMLSVGLQQVLPKPGGIKIIH